MSMHEVDTPPRAMLAPLCRPDARDTLLDRLCEVARVVPDATAVVASDGALTYDELLHRTYAMARKIAHVTPGAPRSIAVDAHCDVRSIVSMLAVIAAGHSLVPLDANLPENRKQMIVDSASALHIDAASLAAAEDSAVPLPTVTGSRLALIAFTSGSTGTAKGVLLSHRMCLSKAYEVSSALALRTRDRIGNALPVSFGAGINTLFAGLLSGATVYCRDPRSTQSTALLEWIDASSLTTLHCSPSLVRSLPGVGISGVGISGVEATESVHVVPPNQVPPNQVPSLRVVTTYGEALHSRDVHAFRTALGSGATFVNWYATTEAGAVAFDEYGPGRALPSGFLPAGKSPKGKRVELLDPAGASVPTGEIGEIHVLADCLADGYLDQDELTRSRFGTDGNVRRYSTGDLGRIDACGVLQLVGRADDAVKVRGYLVEPAEVEAALRAVSGVKEVAVVGHRSGRSHELHAYITWSDAAGTASIEDVRAQLKRTLPPWMQPRHIVDLDVLPRNDRGKVDRASLPQPRTRVASAPAATPTEWIVAGVARKTIGIQNIGRDDEFSELGGTSLTATTMLDELRRAVVPDLTVEDMFTAGTVRSLAEIIDRRLASTEARSRRDGSGDVLVPLRAGGSKAPAFIVGGAGVGPLAFVELVANIDPDRPVYALQPHGWNRRGLPDRTVEKSAKRYLDAIRRVFPSGPVVLVGHSLGGWIALAMAHRMRAAGEPDPRLIILDTRLFRYILDKVPGGTELPAAPPAASREEAGLVLSKAGVAALWLRIQFAGVLRYSTTTRWLVFASIGFIALERHTPKPWAGPLAVLRTESNTLDPRSWNAVATGPMQCLDLAGEHDDLLSGPLVSQVGGYIDRIADAPESAAPR